MEIETEQKRFAYHHAIWAVKEIDFIEAQRKLQAQLGRRLSLFVITMSHVRTGHRSDAGRAS